ncbi:hypothetical protein BGZ95_004580 [Linnemannia exigua]|uniref:Uncharacterized protein n=1 Tax=Linnemannia exigua TaxID=604196 RepID=A0AAD4DHQ3_9FUNG|nr:hypothetical protein BGZ95_004580 [Linnemannia exigua]
MNQPKPVPPHKNYVPAPPSPKHSLANRANSDFYSSPYFENKRKNSTLLPSPPVITMDQETKNFYFNSADDRPSNQTSPIISTVQPKVNVTMSPAPLGLRSSIHSQLRSLNVEDAVPFRVNPEDVPPRPTSANANLSENVLRGLKRLSNEALATRRGGSPVSQTNNSNSNIIGNTDNSLEDERQRLLHKRIDALNEQNNKLELKLQESTEQRRFAEQEQRQTRLAYEQLAKEKQDLQAKFDAQKRDYETMSKNYLEHVRLIRATDDDHSTIIDRLTHLKSFIEQMIRKAQGSRSVNLNRAVAIEYLKSYGLLDNFPVPERSLEPFHLNLFMEAMVMRALVDRFFDQPLCCVFEYNKGFSQIYDWMNSRNHSQAVRWRQQLCLMLTQDPETKARQDKEVAMTADALTELISGVYNGVNEGSKIRDICNKAFELSVAMTGIDSVIKPVSPPLNTPYNEEYMRTSLKSNPQGKVALVIFPGFKDKEENFNIGPKVWCY